MAEPSPQASGDDVSRKSEQDWVKELADKESEYGTQLGAMTQKNAQMRVELKKLQQELSKTQQELASERTAHAALQKVAVKQAVDRDDGDAELAELDAKLGARMSRSHGDGEEGMVSLCSPNAAAGTPSYTISDGSRGPSPEARQGASSRALDANGVAVLAISGAKAGGGAPCCSMS